MATTSNLTEAVRALIEVLEAGHLNSDQRAAIERVREALGEGTDKTDDSN